jgi:hypothetical protein
MIVLNNMKVVPTAPQPSTQRSEVSNVRLYYLVYVLILIQLVGWLLYEHNLKFAGKFFQYNQENKVGVSYEIKSCWSFEGRCWQY